MNELPEDFKRHMAENKRKSLERCARVKKPQTNADRILAMSDEELAEFIVKIKYPYRSDGKDYEIALNWLKSPVEVDE